MLTNSKEGLIIQAIQKIIICFSCSIFFILIANCSRYQVTLNDREIYRPPVLLENIAVADPALEACILQTIKDQNITKVENLNQLICTNGGIKTLAGIEQLSALAILVLDDNELINITALTQLSQLTTVKLVNNSNLPCSQLHDLANTNSALKISKPGHCN